MVAVLAYGFGRIRARWRDATLSVVVSCLAAWLAGCGETYCQSGPKYGTQCYDMNAIEWQETQVRGESVGERYAAGPTHPTSSVSPTTPSPGCAFVETGSAYFMSAACVSQRQPAPGAVR